MDDKLKAMKEKVRKERETDSGFMDKLKKKLKKLKKEDPNIYPMN
jgi:hypothetical protein